jgi:hypothetical protein
MVYSVRIADFRREYGADGSDVPHQRSVLRIVTRVGNSVLAMAYSLRLTSLSVVDDYYYRVGLLGFLGDYVGQGWSETLAGEEFSWSSQMGNICR